MFLEGRPDLDGVGDFNEGYGLGRFLPKFEASELEKRRKERAESGEPVPVAIPAITNEQVFPSLGIPSANELGTNILPDQLRLEAVRAELAVQIARSYE